MADWCNNCGLCCMHMRTPPFLGYSDPEWRALPQELKDELNTWFRYDGVLKRIVNSPRYDMVDMKHGDDFPCIWLNLATGKCRHYEHRPSVCRDYEVGNESCRELRLAVKLTIKGMPVVAD